MHTPTRNQGDIINQATDWFATEMRSTLFDNLDKGGWQDCTDAYLIERLEEEVKELKVMIRNDGPKELILREATDVANFAMMIADPGRRGRKS